MNEPEIFWIEQNLGDAAFPALFSLATFKGPNGPKIVGTAFVISANNNYAIAITVAHNFDGLLKAQQPMRNRHPSALLDLFGEAEEISLEPGEVIAIYSDGDGDGDGVWAANVDWVFADKKRDLAIFKISTSDGADAFRSQFSLSEYTPTVGDDVMVMGYDMTLEELEAGDISVKLRLICRTGKVSEYHPEGHIFVRGACIETTIPVFGGMSGGPVFLRGEVEDSMCVIGAISSDPEGTADEKNNPARNGQSAVTLLESSLERSDQAEKTFTLKMISGHFQHSNAEGEQNPDLVELKDKVNGGI